MKSLNQNIEHFSLFSTYRNERRGRVGTIPVSYSGVLGFISRPEDRLRLRLLVISSLPPCKFRDRISN
jgi:hypothetical protein